LGCEEQMLIKVVVAVGLIFTLNPDLVTPILT